MRKPESVREPEPVVLNALAAKVEAAMAATFPHIGTEVFDAAEAHRILAATTRPDIPEIPVGRVEDRTIAGTIPARVYRPSDMSSARPVVVFFHGGGYVICDLDTHDDICRMLCAGSDSVVVSVDYRLAPEHRFPAAFEDACAAVHWAYENADALGGDPARLAVAGDSAGGGLAAACCQAARDRGGPPIAFQLLVYPVTDAAQNTGSYREFADGGGFLTAHHMRWFWQQYLGPGGDGRNPYASPLQATDLSGLPPACVITAECDPLRDEGEAYAERLAQAGVPVERQRYNGVFHGFFGIGHILPEARAANALAVHSLRTALS